MASLKDLIVTGAAQFNGPVTVSSNPSSNMMVATKQYVDNSVNATTVTTAISNMTSTQAGQARSNLGAEPEKFVVTVTESSGTYSADKTFAEMVAAYNTGKTIIVYLDYTVASLAYYSDADEEMYFSSLFEGYDNSYVFVNLFYVSSDDDWTYTQITLNKRPNLVTVSGSTITITPADNTIYKYGTLTSLTITNPPATGAYSIVFTSGSTATTTSIPATILGLENFSAKANTIYEINVLDNRAVVGSWAVSV